MDRHFLVISEESAVLMTPLGKRLDVVLFKFNHDYQAKVVMYGPIGGVYDGEFDLRDEVALYYGTAEECLRYIERFADKHFSPVATVVQGCGTKNCDLDTQENEFPERFF